MEALKPGDQASTETPAPASSEPKPDLAYALKGLELNITPLANTWLWWVPAAAASRPSYPSAGLYLLTSGRISMDGRDIEKVDMRSVRRFVGVVSQENVLFQGTISENIAHGNRHFSREEVTHAAMEANAHDFITQLEHGYDTYVGERREFVRRPKTTDRHRSGDSP